MNLKLNKLLMAGILTSALSFQSSPLLADGLTDGAIIAIYNQVNTFDIETAGLALKCSQSENVLSLAKMVQTDHTAVRQMAADLATELNLAKSLPAGREAATNQHATMLGKLQKKCHSGFDKAYLTHEAQFHTSAIDAVRTILIPNAKSPKLKALMTKILPGFEHHLAETKKALTQL